MNPKILDDLANRLVELVPGGVTEITKDIEKNMRALLQAKLSDLNLVTRDEFNVQQKVLANTQQQVIWLEEKISELEKAYNKK
ncbi:MAG: accessory factor UbiK family protein [Gammaproteobacteria bacterium]|nr:accessory factor UbiK family protein [Gammaproteobacteria bacterium]